MNKFNILTTQYTLNNRALEIYVSGCSGNPHCKNCHNPESWSFNQGDLYDDDYCDKLTDKIWEFNSMIDNIMIFGGEPLDQDLEELNQLLIDVYCDDKPIWIFTRYNFEEVPSFIKDLCDYIKCGRYLPELKVDSNIQYGINLATSNQKIYKKGIDY